MNRASELFSTVQNFTRQAIEGSHYVLRGLSLATQPGVRVYLVAPLICNTLVFVGLGLLALAVSGQWMDAWLTWIPEQLSIFTSLVKIFLIGFWLLVYGVSYVVFGNLAAAPFNSLLSEKVETYLTGKPPAEFSLVRLPAIIVRTVKREIRKLTYFFLRATAVALLCLVLSLIPVLSFLAPVIAFIWGCWWLAMEYIDYPLDNRAAPFSVLPETLKTQPGVAFGFAAPVMLASVVPVLNILAMPVAVTGGTALWIERLETNDSV